MTFWQPCGLEPRADLEDRDRHARPVCLMVSTASPTWSKCAWVISTASSGHGLCSSGRSRRVSLEPRVDHDPPSLRGFPQPCSVANPGDAVALQIHRVPPSDDGWCQTSVVMLSKQLRCSEQRVSGAPSSSASTASRPPSSRSITTSAATTSPPALRALWIASMIGTPGREGVVDDRDRRALLDERPLDPVLQPVLLRLLADEEPGPPVSVGPCRGADRTHERIGAGGEPADGGRAHAAPSAVVARVARRAPRPRGRATPGGRRSSTRNACPTPARPTRASAHVRAGA